MSAYDVVKNHGGTIGVFSENDNGSTFIIYLPVSEKEMVQKKMLEQEILKGKETVLLVDDQEAIRDVGHDMLAALGYNVLLAESGNAALETFRSHKEDIDVVILDMIMPLVSGSETFDALRKIDPQLKVILSSGYSLDGQATQILDRGCRGFIQKPFSIDTLSQKIREVLD